MNTRLFLLLLLLCALVPMSGSAGTAVVMDDAYTTTVRPKLKAGGKGVMVVVGKAETGFVRFDLSALPDGLPSSQVAKATMRLGCDRNVM